jgi:hypothetical protein
MDTLILKSLKQDYNVPYMRQRLLSTLKGEHKISLRSIDWFITNYSKKHNIYYMIFKDKQGYPTSNETQGSFDTSFNAHQSYKSQLKAYSKKSFDPFCRRQRITFTFHTGEQIETTIGQLNFFRWAIQNLVIDYIMEHKDTIEGDMNKCLRHIKEKSKGKGGRKQREELSLSATRGLSRTNAGIRLTFD